MDVGADSPRIHLRQGGYVGLEEFGVFSGTKRLASLVH